MRHDLLRSLTSNLYLIDCEVDSQNQQLLAGICRAHNLSVDVDTVTNELGKFYKVRIPQEFKNVPRGIQFNIVLTLEN